LPNTPILHYSIPPCSLTDGEYVASHFATPELLTPSQSAHPIVVPETSALRLDFQSV
jgi:hypothetical protein